MIRFSRLFRISILLALALEFVSVSEAKTIDLGVVLTRPVEDHAFILNRFGLSEEKTKGYLSDLARDLAFSKELQPEWPDWDYVKIGAVYCLEGGEGAQKFADLMEDPSSVVVCESLDRLLKNCSAVLLLNTGGDGLYNYEVASAALSAGKPVFVDKFLSTDLDEVRTLLELAEEKGVALMASSYIWTSAPGLELKKSLGDKPVTKVTSTGWSGSNMAADIHTIAQLQLLSADRKPASVQVKKSKDLQMALVTFEDGLIGELAPRPEGGGIFDLSAEAEGEIHKADSYQGEHSRPSPINLYNLVFEKFRGNGAGIPKRLMLDSIAIWNAARESARTGNVVSIAETLARSTTATFEAANLEFHSPTIAHPYYHFTADLRIPRKGQVFVSRLTANLETLRDSALVEGGTQVDPDRPTQLRRLAIFPAVHTKRPEATYEKPTLIGRLDWKNGERYKIHVQVEYKDGGERYWANLEGTAPEQGGYWDSAWRRYQSVVVTETAGKERNDEPVEVTFLYHAEDMTNPDGEIRVVRLDRERGIHEEVPSQVVDFDSVKSEEPPMYNEEGQLKPASFLPTDSATVVFPASVGSHECGLYLIFYGNPQAGKMEYPTELAISGNPPGVTVENTSFSLKLHELSGMLDEVTLKSAPNHRLVHKKETNGAIQWNPDCYPPPRPWYHVSDWEPGKFDYDFEEQRGPVVYRTRRWGMMPGMPEIACSMNYEFYATVPYFSMRSAVHVRYDVAVQAFRNAEIVFSRESLNEAAWWDPITERVVTSAITSYPDLSEWTLPEETPWIAFFDREKGVGFAGIQVSSAYGGIEGNLRTLNPYMYITTGPWVYWTRALLYPYGSRNPQQLIRVQSGSVFLEEWAYLPFRLGTNKEELFAEVAEWQAIVTHPLEVHLEDPTHSLMQVPEEIYLEPEKTGWE